jgi:phage terminase large subunit GpA-like protein
MKITSEILKPIWPAWTPGLTRSVSQWADAHRILPRGTSQHPGKWRTDRFPYLKGPMDAFSNPKVRTVILLWGTQLGKTEIILNSIGYAVDEAPGPIMVVYPNESIARKVSETRLFPMIKATPRLKDKLLSESKTAQVHFLDGTVLYLVSAQTPSELASVPIEYLIADEIGKFPTFSGREGDPIGLARERLKAFSYTSKMLLASSPTTADGPISRYFDSCQEHLEFYIQCPHCKSYQTLEFSNIKWDASDLPSTDPRAWREAKKTAMYFCGGCGASISDQEKVAALQSGEWLREDGMPPDPEAASIGFELSSLYSPLITWGTMAAEFLEVKNDPPRLMVFVNGWLCQEWEDAAIEKKDPDEVLTQHLTDLAPQTVPEDAWCLTCGIDSQATGFFYVVRAWLRDRTSYLVDSGALPSLQAVGQLVFERAYPIENSDKMMLVWRACIDTGGTRLEDGPSMTEQLYQWLRYNSRGLIHGVKGSSWRTGTRVQPKVLDKMPGTHGKPIPGGLTLFLIDTNEFKETLHYRLSIDKDAEGAFLFHSEVGEDYVEQLLSEFKRRDTKTGKTSWVPIKGRKNHFLDAEVYSMAATDAQFLGGLDLLRRPQGVIGVGDDPLTTLDPPIRKKKKFVTKSRVARW